MKSFLNNDVSLYFNYFVSVFIIIITCIIPLVINPYAVDWYYHPKALVLYFTCFFMFIVYIMSRKNVKKKLSNIDIAACAYLFWIFLSTIFSVNVGQSITGKFIREEGLLTISCYVFLLFISSKHYVFKRKHLNYLLLSAVIIAVYGIMQYFKFDPIPRDAFMKSFNCDDYSSIGARNFLGTYLTIILPVAVFLYIHENKIIYLASASVIYFDLLCTVTRGAWIGSIASAVVFVYYFFKYKFNKKNLAVVVILFIVITAVFNICSKGKLSGRFMTITYDAEKVVEETNDADTSGSGRMFIWKRAIKLVPQYPVFGCGPDTFDIAFMGRFKSDVEKFWGNVTVDKAHNEYLNTAVTCGIPALIFYIVLLTLILKKAKRAAEKNIMIIPVICSICGYIVQAFFNISVVSVAPLYWVMLGIAVNFSDNDYSIHS